MRKIITLEGRQFRHDSEVPKTHVILGQRDEEQFRPKIMRDEVELTKVDLMTREERTSLAEHAQARMAGKFRIKPLDWAGSAEEAQEKLKQFPAPEWINLKVHLITDLGSIHEHA